MRAVKTSWGTSWAVSLLAASTPNPAVPDCGVHDPVGYFTGLAISRQTGRLDLALNLWCAADRYQGTLVSSLGSFPIISGIADSAHIQLTFLVGADSGLIAATVDTGGLHGSFRVAGDSGSVELSRIGDPRAPGWDQVRLDLRAQQWREDLAFFAREIVARHANAFHAIARRRFDSLVAALDRRLDRLNGDQAYVELDRLANLVGDAHTYFALPEDDPRFPFAIRRFGADYRLVAAVAGDQRLLGSRVLKIEALPITAAILRLWSFTPANENPSLRQARAEGFLSSGTMLHGIGISRSRDMVSLTVKNDSGEEFQVQVGALSGDSPGALPWKDVFRTTPLFAQHLGDSFWYQYLPESRTVYCNFRGYDSLPAKAAGLLALIGSVRPEKVVLDLRQNSGGDYELGLRALIQPLSRLDLGRRGRLFVAIGVNTFSAGMANAAQLRSRARAILVGEPIGEKPNSYQEPRELRLPNSHLILRYSTKYYQFASRKSNVVLPDHLIVPTWAEYRDGRDPVLEWVLRQRGKDLRR
jgi:hypothetical protein